MLKGIIMILRNILKLKIKIFIFLILFLSSLYSGNAIDVTTLSGEVLFRCEGLLINSYTRGQNHIAQGIYETFKIKQNMGNIVYIQNNNLEKNIKLEPKLSNYKFSFGKKNYILSSTSKKLYGEVEVIRFKGRPIFTNVNLIKDKTNYSYSYSMDANTLTLNSKKRDKIICISDSVLNMYQVIAFVLGIA